METTSPVTSSAPGTALPASAMGTTVILLAQNLPSKSMQSTLTGMPGWSSFISIGWVVVLPSTVVSFMTWVGATTWMVVNSPLGFLMTTVLPSGSMDTTLPSKVCTGFPDCSMDITLTSLAQVLPSTSTQVTSTVMPGLTSLNPAVVSWMTTALVPSDVFITIVLPAGSIDTTVPFTEYPPS